MHGPFFIDFGKVAEEMCSLCSVIFLLSDSHSMHNEFCVNTFSQICIASTQPRIHAHLVKKHKFGTSLVRKNIFVITHLIHKRKIYAKRHSLHALCMYNHGAHSMLNGWRQKRKLLHVLFNECWVLYFKSMAYVMTGLCVLLVSAFRSCCCVCVCFSSCSLRVTHLAQCFFFYFRLYLFFSLTSKKILNAMDKNQHAGYSIFVLITCTGCSNAWRKYRFSLHTFAVFSRTMNILKIQLSK